MPLRSLGRLAALSSFLLAGLVVAGQYAGVTPPPAAYKQGFDSVTTADCKKWLSYLAGPECEGRGTGQPGFQKAAEYVAARFKEFGLKPGGDGGTYFQNVPFWRTRITDSSGLEVDGAKIGMKGNIALTTSIAKDTVVEGDVLIVSGAGDSGQLEDASIAKDKIVILTQEKNRDLRSQVRGAGATAVFTVAKSVPAPGWRVTRTQPSSEFAQTPSGSISDAAFQRLASMLDVTMPQPSEGSLVTAKGSKKVKLSLRVQSEAVNVPNVVALLPGSDPALKSELVGIGAHLDHIGSQNGVVYSGADDDGSGSTALLAVAKAFSKNKLKPKRTVQFMAFCGEEMGLIGSGYQSDHMSFPPEKWSCELQLDMVGRNEEGPNDKPQDNVNTIHLIGSKRISNELNDLVLDQNKHVGFVFEWDEEAVYTRSDHYNFARKGIPIAFLFDGFHPDYHQPTDTVEKINFDKIANAARLFYLVGSEAANAPGLMKRDVKQ